MGTVQYLVEAGVDPKGLSSQTFTPLAFAAKNGLLDMVRFLIEAGADMELGMHPPLGAAASQVEWGYTQGFWGYLAALPV